MADGEGGRLQEARDGNLSSILSQIRDYGPALLADAAQPPESHPADIPAPPAPPIPPIPPILPGPPVPPVLPVPPGRSESETRPDLPPAPVARTRWWPTSSMALAVLAAILVTGGVIAVLYRAPIESGSHQERAPDGNAALREEIAALQASISSLAERVETIATADQARRQEAAVRARTEPASGQTADPEHQGRGAPGLEAKLDALGQRLDAMAEKVSRLTLQTERSLAQALVVPASPGPQRVAPPLAEPNAAAPKPVVANAVVVDAAAAGNPPAAARPVGDDAKAAVLRVAPERTAAPGSSPSHPGPVAGTPPAPAIVADPSTQPATPPPAPDLSPKVKVPMTGADPHPDAVAAVAIPAVQTKPVTPVAPVAPAQPVTVRADPPMAEPVDEFAKFEMPSVSGPRGAAATAPAESAAPAAADRKAPPAVAGEEWFIDLVTVRSRPSAVELQQTYRDKGVDAQVVARGRKGPFGVRVGGFSSRRDALERASAIKTALGLRDVRIVRR